MDELSAGLYDSEPTHEIRSAADRHGGASVAAAHAHWREAVDGLPLGEYDKNC